MQVQACFSLFVAISLVIVVFIAILEVYEVAGPLDEIVGMPESVGAL